MTFGELLSNFFTHKDFLPSADQIPGTLFTPLHWLFSVICVTAVILLAVYLSKKDTEVFRRAYSVVWIVLVIAEISKITWETLSGATVSFEWTGILPLYPCSIFMYALPFALYGKGKVKDAACGYICTLGFVGGAVNFVYPANVLSNYSCLSFAGFHTLFYHGTMVLCALYMIISGYHSFKNVTRWHQLILPACPLIIVSVAANAFNLSPISSDYMFFTLESFIFAPIGAAIPGVAVEIIIVYIVYIILHALPYLPSFVANRRKCVTA
jgi:hypothetical protein